MLSRVTNQPFTRLSKRLAAIGTYALDRNILGIVLIVCLSTLFFPRGERHARWIFEGAVVPLCVLLAFTPRKPPFANSTILVACAAYLAAMMAAALLGADSTWADLLRDTLAAAMILTFLCATGWIISNKPIFATQLVFSLSTVAAVSAAINILFYFLYFAPPGDLPIAAYRLMTSVGMRDYANSTNISATYAVFFIGAVATLLHTRLTTIERSVLAVSSIVLLAGVLLTQSRGALGGVIVGLAALLLTAPPRIRNAGILSFVALALAASAMPIVREALTQRGSSFRPELWSRFLEVIALRPWIGHGPLSPAGVTLHTGVFLDQAHNLILSGWFRAGIVGAVAMAYILVGGLFWTFRYRRAGGDSVPFCVLATIATAGMVDYQLMITEPTWPWVTFWLPFALAIGVEMTWRKSKAGLSGGQLPPPTVKAPDEAPASVERRDIAS